MPLLFHGLTAVLIVIGLMCVRSLAGAWSGPPHNALQGDILPLGIRRRWNSLSMVTGSVIAVGVVPLAGWIIRGVSGAAGYQVTMLIAAVLGFVATAFYSRIPEPEGAEGEARGRHKGLAGSGWGAALKDRRFIIFCAIQFVWSFGIQISAPFFTVYMRDDLGFGVDTIALLATGTAIGNIVAVTVISRLVDDKNVAKWTAIGMLVVPLMPMAWYLVSTPWGVLAAKVYGVAAWACVQVSSLPLILSITPREHRAAFIALTNSITAIAAIIVPIPAGWIYEAYGFKTNLLLSATGRGLAGLMFLVMYLRGAFNWSYDDRPDPKGSS